MNMVKADELLLNGQVDSSQRSPGKPWSLDYEQSQILPRQSV